MCFSSFSICLIYAVAIVGAVLFLISFIILIIALVLFFVLHKRGSFICIAIYTLCNCGNNIVTGNKIQVDEQVF